MNIQKVKIAGANGGTVEAGYFQTSVTAILQLGNLELESGKQYTLHGYAKASTSTTMACEGKNTAIGTGWTEFAFLITANSKMMQLAFDPATWWIYNWKLEIGDIITPWTPSPVDTKNDIEEKASEWSQTAESIRSEVSRVSNNLDSAKSEWNQTAEGFKTEISKKIGSEEAKKSINASADSIRTKTGTIVWEAENSSMTEDGKFACINGQFKGKVQSNNGNIGGWSIDEGRIYTSIGDYELDLSASGENFIDLSSWIRMESRTAHYLVVTSSGEMYAPELNLCNDGKLDTAIKIDHDYLEKMKNVLFPNAIELTAYKTFGMYYGDSNAIYLIFPGLFLAKIGTSISANGDIPVFHLSTGENITHPVTSGKQTAQGIFFSLAYGGIGSCGTFVLCNTITINTIKA